MSIARVDESQGALHPDESMLSHEMTSSRFREFCAARTLGRAALRSLGAQESAIGRGTAGEPLWSSGIVGSLSHTRTHAAALVAKTSGCIAVGLDLDDERTIGAAAAAELMDNVEVDLIVRLGAADSEVRARNIVFSAKEAIFKCQYPLTLCADLAFDEVQLVGGSGADFLFGVSVRRNLPALTNLASRFRINTIVTGGLTLAIAWVQTWVDARNV